MKLSKHVILSVAFEEWPLRRPFVVSRRTVTVVETLRVTMTSDGVTGEGEASGLYYEGETRERMRDAIMALASRWDEPIDRERLRMWLPPSGARAAVDAALLDLEARISGVPAHVTLGVERLEPVATAVTISRGAPADMAERARDLGAFATLKLKVGGDGPLDADLARIAAVRRVVSDATRLIVDANTAWRADDVARAGPRLADLGVVLLEQPFLPGTENGLSREEAVVPVCADEAVRDRADLPNLPPIYVAVNVKLEKTGGLSEALDLAAAVRARGLGLMVGCMNGTSLSLAPALILAQGADYVDLDAAFDLVRDRPGGPRHQDGRLVPAEPPSWGQPAAAPTMSGARRAAVERVPS